MTSETNQEGDFFCAICLEDEIASPITLPCNHTYCSKCVQDWRSKYDLTDAHKTCPRCRGKIPPSKELVMQYEMSKDAVANFEMYASMMGMEGRTISEEEKHQFMQSLKKKIIKFEEIFGVNYEPLDDNESNLDLPDEVFGELFEGLVVNSEIRPVMNWLGSPPIPQERLHAYKRKEVGEVDLLTMSCGGDHHDLVFYLLQNGYDFNRKDETGLPRVVSCLCCPLRKRSLKIFLQWGIEKIPFYLAEAERARNSELVNLLKYPLGGRRCKIEGLKKRSDLNGLTGVVGKYFPREERYAFTVEDGENRGEQIKVRTSNLKQKDRTVDDPGYIYEWNEAKGKLVAKLPPKSTRE